MKVSRARRASTCTECNRRIEIDDSIVQPVHLTWVHLRCGQTFVMKRLKSNPGNGELGQGDIAPVVNGVETALRAEDHDSPEREARTDHLLPDVLHTTVDALTQDCLYEQARDAAGEHHKPWTDDGRAILTKLVERGLWISRKGRCVPVSARLIGHIFGRSTAAIQSQIVKQYGADSPEVAKYGTYDRPGPLTEHAPGDDFYDAKPYWLAERQRPKRAA